MKVRLGTLQPQQGEPLPAGPARFVGGEVFCDVNINGTRAENVRVPFTPIVRARLSIFEWKKDDAVFTLIMEHGVDVADLSLRMDVLVYGDGVETLFASKEMEFRYDFIALQVQPGPDGSFELVAEYPELQAASHLDGVRDAPVIEKTWCDGQVEGAGYADGWVVVHGWVFPEDPEKDELTGSVLDGAIDQLRYGLNQRLRSRGDRKGTPEELQQFIQDFTAKNKGKSRGAKEAAKAEFGITNSSTINRKLARLGK